MLFKGADPFIIVDELTLKKGHEFGGKVSEIQGANHIDQLIRQTRVHHVQLSMMADNKAGMLITLASIMATLVIPRITEPHFRWPALLLVCSCMLTICFACITVMPKVKLHHDKTRGGRGNLLFFASFIDLTWDEYLEEMSSVLSTSGNVYEAQLKEIYMIGQYLGDKKYRFLRLAYMTFLVGFFASILLLIYTLFA